MPTELLALAALPWVLIAFYQVGRRAFVFLLLCLLLAPIVTYLVQRNLGGAEVYQSEGTQGRARTSDAYLARRVTISLADLVQPNRALIGILFIILILNTLSKKTRWVRLDQTEVWMAIFSVVLIVSVFGFSERVGHALRVAIDGFIIPFLTYIFTRRLVTTEKRFQQMIRTMAYMGVYVIVFCLIERLTTPGLTYRIRGPFESGNTLHVVMSVVFFAIWSSWRVNKDPLNRFVRHFVLLFIPVIIVLSLGRGNWVGFLLGLSTFLYFGRRLVNRRQLSGASGLGLLLVLVVTIGVTLFVPDELFERRVINPDNWLGRLATWKAVAQEGLQAPIFGIGLNNLQIVLRDTVVQHGTYGNYQTVHNSYLSILAELGVLGLLVYLRMIACIFQNGLRLYRERWHLQQRYTGTAVISLLLAYLVPAMFANTLYIPGLIQFYVYAFIGAVSGTYGTTWSRCLPYKVAHLRQAPVSTSSLPNNALATLETAPKPLPPRL